MTSSGVATGFGVAGGVRAGVWFEARAGGRFDGYTFARSSAATYADFRGRLQNAITGQLRTHWVRVGGVYRPYLLIEEARTQLVTDPENLGNWTVSGTPVLTSGQADPFGGTSAYLVADDSGGAAEFIRGALTFTGNATKAWALFVRQGTMASSGNQQLSLFDVTAGTARTLLDITGWANGEPIITESVGALLDIERCSGGWWRLLCQAPGVVAANTNEVRIVPAATASATGSIYAFGANAWNAVAPSSYQGPSLASRAVESLNGPFPWPPQAMWVYHRFLERGVAAMPNNTKLWYLGHGNGANPHVRVQVNASGFYQMIHQRTGSSQSATLAAAPAIGSIVEHLAILQSDGRVELHQSVNEAAETKAGPSGALALEGAWSAPEMWFGSNGTSTVGINPLERLTVGPWPGYPTTVAQARVL